MSVDVLAPGEQKKTSFKNILGPALIITSLVLPWVPVFNGHLSIMEAWVCSFKVLVSLVFAYGISWVITRKKSSPAKARTRIILGGLALLISLASIGNATRERGDAKEFGQKMLSLTQDHEGRFDSLNTRFESINAASLITPAAIATEEGRTTARARLDEYRKLLAERRQLKTNYINDVNRIISEMKTGPVKSAASQTWQSRRIALQEIYDGLDRTQTQLADHQKIVLDWSHEQRDPLSLFRGGILFASKQQQDELNVPLDLLNRAQVDLNKMVEHVEIVQPEHRRRYEQGVQQMKKNLAI